ncbi:MAG TPA: glycine betaine ABC transporter substrate-binding protein [Bryobacteraceae bacterium]|nr:glycine betaine ABC transporter substrate-binding protein [Bryobacteraceae bacterium]
MTLTLLALSGGCGPKKPKVIVGSKNFTEQVVLGEIVAQHLERRLGRPIERKLNLTGTLITYQALQAGEIALYPEYTGTIQAEILKEPPGTEASIMFERVRSEMHRVAQTEVFEPLGIDNRFVMVVRSSDAVQNKVSTLSEAAQVKDGWKLGVGYEFQSRSDGMPLLNKYHLPMSAAPRSMDLGLLFKALSEGKVTMIAANATDGPLASPDYTVLADDQKLFPPYQACLMVREDVLAAEPALRGALKELSGKFTNEVMRKLNAQVDVDHRQQRDVAAEFLASAGLK